MDAFPGPISYTPPHTTPDNDIYLRLVGSLHGLLNMPLSRVRLLVHMIHVLCWLGGMHLLQLVLPTPIVFGMSCLALGRFGHCFSITSTYDTNTNNGTNDGVDKQV
jgi:hypothetical protein